MNSLFEGSIGKYLRTTILAVSLLVGIFVVVEIIAAVIGLHYIGAGITPTDTIVVSGHGEAYGIPDIATFDFSVISDKATVLAAQADASAKINTITNYLVSAGVSKSDIQTSGYSVSPQYTYGSTLCPPGGVTSCLPGKQVLIGYEVDQTTTVKVRDTSKAGDLLSAVGSQGASDVSNLTFTFDSPDSVQEQARNNAITDAQGKANTLAKSLGVSLVRVVSFSENVGGVVPPTPYGLVRTEVASAPVAPTISPGENMVTDDVSITYEIR